MPLMLSDDIGDDDLWTESSVEVAVPRRQSFRAVRRRVMQVDPAARSVE